MDILAGRLTRLLLSVPPRHGKSQSFSEFFPGFYLGNRPNEEIILGSYESGIAAGFGERARNAFREAAPSVFGLDVHKRRNASDDWCVQGHLGRMVTAGVGAGMTGKTAHLLLIDDPIKGAAEANSETMRAKLWDWWISEARTRLTPGTRPPACVIIHTRWHEDDLIGRLLREMKAGGEKWTYINLPAIAEEDGAPDPLGRAPGEALWPERFPVDWFTEARRNPYWWSALYQGRPQPAGGGIFKREYFRYFTEEPHYYVLEQPGGAKKRVSKEHGYRFSTTDLASSLATTADYTVTSVWFVSHEGDLILLDVYRDRIEGPDQLTLIENALSRHRLAFAAIESKSYQLTMVQTLLRRGRPVQELKADADKVSRALTASVRMAAGSIYFRLGGYAGDQSLVGLDVLEAELLGFPRAAHDDFVDTVAYAAIHVAEGSARPGAG